jgi:replicative DNA helicase
MTPAEQIEIVLLGYCLSEDESTLSLMASMVKPAHFSLDSHKRIARAIVKMFRKNQPVNFVTVGQELAHANELETVGGMAYISGLTADLPTRLGQRETIDIIERLKEFWRKRELFALSAKIADTCNTEPSAATIELANTAIGKIVGDSSSKNPHISNGTIEHLEKWNRARIAQGVAGLSYGIPVLDKLTDGLKPGEQTALGAASGVGKTTVLCQVVYANICKGIPCHIFSLEATAEQLRERFWAMYSGIPYASASHPKKANDSEVNALMRAAEKIDEMPLYVDDDQSLTLDQILGKARLSMNRYGTRLIALDYIQRLKIDKSEKDEPLRQRVARASTAFADLVKGTNCSSLLLSQLNTGRKSGAQAKPTMYDFRESSQIENDAHTIILLHREYSEKDGHYTNQGAIFVPKQRFGTPCNMHATFDPKTALWRVGKEESYV